MGSKLGIGLSAAAVGLIVAIAAFFGLLQWQHWRQDEANVHGLVQIVNYNIAQGTLKALPDAQAPPAEKKP